MKVYTSNPGGGEHSPLASALMERQEGAKPAEDYDAGSTLFKMAAEEMMEAMRASEGERMGRAFKAMYACCKGEE